MNKVISIYRYYYLLKYNYFSSKIINSIKDINYL